MDEFYRVVFVVTSDNALGDFAVDAVGDFLDGLGIAVQRILDKALSNLLDAFNIAFGALEVCEQCVAKEFGSTVIGGFAVLVTGLESHVACTAIDCRPLPFTIL